MKTYWVWQEIFKRLLLLNTNFNLEDIYYFLTTSSTKWYIENKEAEIVKNNCIFVKKGETINNVIFHHHCTIP